VPPARRLVTGDRQIPAGHPGEFHGTSGGQHFVTQAASPAHELPDLRQARGLVGSDLGEDRDSAPSVSSSTFSAMEVDGLTVARAQVLMRASDRIFELGLALGGHRQEDVFW